jgi:mRNA interferase YafQ
MMKHWLRSTLIMALTGDWKDHRDCHIKPDLVLIYRKLDKTILQLVRLGSHSELGL